jgi:hypothetical protein
MKKIIVAITITLTLGSCAFLRPAVRSANAVARVLCEEYATGRDLSGMTVKDWCRIQKNLSPFIDAVTSLEQSTGLKVAK